METLIRMSIVALLTVSSASAIQFSAQKVGRIGTLARTYECWVGQAASGFASRAMGHRNVRLARAGWEPGAVVDRMKPQRRRYEVAETMQELW